jgi:DNA-binding NtrC family response regulator
MEAAPAEPEPTAPEVRGGVETILLVEDEPSLRELNSEVLREYGYDVLPAHSAAHALEVAARHAAPIGLLLTDVVMPGESGSELARRLLALRPAMKLLYMSGYASDALVQHGVSEATAAFIEKPFAPSALARKVREVLDS